MDFKRLFKAATNVAINKISERAANEAKPGDEGGSTLEIAARTGPNKMGCYKIFCGGLKYVGKAEYGLRHRFVQYYNGTTTGYPSGAKIHENKEEIRVEWRVCGSKEECRRLEAEWIKRYQPEWNAIGGWKDYE